MKSLLILLLINLQSLLLTSAAWGQSVPASNAGTRELLLAAREATELNAAKFQAVRAQGNIRHLQFERDVESPTVTLDADLLLIYQAPKFRLTLQYANPEEHDAGDPFRPTETWLPNVADGSGELKLEQQTILFDGKTVITIERARKGAWRGDIYFDFHKQNMLRMAGFPFEDPVALWNEPMRLDRADLVDSETMPLAGGGFLGVLNKDTYRLKYYFLSGFAHDLRRVSSYRLGEDIPFRDWHLIWQAANGGHYVERLVRRINEATGTEALTSGSAITHELVELEYKTFTVNPTIDPSDFELAALALPQGSLFYDHRVNVNGKPKVMQWNGSRMVAVGE